MLVCAFNSLPKANIQIFPFWQLFLARFFSGKTSLPVNNSYLEKFPYDKAEILGVCLYNHIELCFAQLCYRLF